MSKVITLSHGDGGVHTNWLINNIFYKNFHDTVPNNKYDAAVLNCAKGKLAFTTDSFIVKPLFFSGGDIGKLAVCGTVNDLVVSGATPLYLSASFIIEEGFDMQTLETIAKSMGEACKESCVEIVTGDTKVVEKGAADGLFINTTGIGVVKNYYPKKIKHGDQIIITGTIAQHGTAIAAERYNLNLTQKVQSDCMPLNHIWAAIEKHGEFIKYMKDPTRGGLATALHEIMDQNELSICISENKVPISQDVLSINNMLGIDPLYLACEGRMLLVVGKNMSDDILKDIRNCKACEYAEIIGEFIYEPPNQKVYLKTLIGGKRILEPLTGVMLPRIC